MSFTITRLVGNRAVVRGTDIFGAVGETVLDTTEWDEVNANTKFDQAVEAFDRAVEQFFAPLDKAADQMQAARTQTKDPVSYVVVSEHVEGVPAQPEVLHHLSRDSIVLRLIESGATSRLAWVNEELEVLDKSTHPATPATEGNGESVLAGFSTEQIDAIRDELTR